MIGWIKRNKLSSLLIVILLFVFLGNRSGVRPLSFLGTSNNYGSTSYESADMAGAPIALGNISKSVPSYNGVRSYQQNYAPVASADRLVVQESNISLKVNQVRESVDKITDQAKSVGGYMVSSSLNSPEEAPFATVSVRIPAEKLTESLSFYRSLAVKVTSENLLGTDVTDEYTDIEARLATLAKTKAKFEQIMDNATLVQDILQVQREIISLQDQIDSLKGRQNYLEKTAALAKITIYLSTDEYALPYAPPTTFRPNVIFKEAVRSLVGTLRGIGKLGIWIGVYTPVWLPILLIAWLIKRKAARRTQP